MSTRIDVLLEGAVMVEGELRHAFVDMASGRRCAVRRRILEPYLPERDKLARAGAGTARPRVPAA